MVDNRNNSHEQPKQETYHACDDLRHRRTLEEGEMEVLQRDPRLIIPHHILRRIKQRSEQFECETQNW